MNPKAYQLRQIVCEVCGRRCRAQLKDRDICQTCLRKQPRARCTRCGHMKHYVDEESGLCPRCAPVAARPVSVCARCSRARAIYNLEEQLCCDCNQAVRAGARSRDKRVKVKCAVCGQMRPSQLFGRAICPACWREECNGRGICSKCDRLRVFQVKAERLCKQCYKDHLAPQALRRYVESYTTPYPYNRILFELLAATIDWAAVTSKTDRKFRAFGQFLQTQQLSEPLTWETLEQVLHRWCGSSCVWALNLMCALRASRTRMRLSNATSAPTIRSVYRCIVHARLPQARTSGNQPPCVAFPRLPNLPPLPQFVDPDAWLPHVHGKHFVRKVRANGTVRIDDGSYYIHMNMIGQYVDLCVDAPQQIFVIWPRKQVLKQIPIEGLQRTLLPFKQFAALMCQQALSEQRRLLQAQLETATAAL